MQEKGDHICFCPLEGVIDIISKKWALLIVNALGNYDSLRFNRLMEELQGISPKTLADALKQLQERACVFRKWSKMVLIPFCPFLHVREDWLRKEIRNKCEAQN